MKRTPLKQRKENTKTLRGLRGSHDKDRAKILRALDRITPKLVKERDGHKCQRCGKEVYGCGAHWAHIRSRSSYWMRWDLTNGLLLCCGCHGWFDGNPLLGTDWLTTNFPARIPYLNWLELQKPRGKIPTEHFEELLQGPREKMKALETE